jgi:hypothetical protein
MTARRRSQVECCLVVGVGSPIDTATASTRTRRKAASNHRPLPSSLEFASVVALCQHGISMLHAESLTSHMGVFSRQHTFTQHAKFCVCEGGTPDMEPILCANLAALPSERGRKELWCSGKMVQPRVQSSGEAGLKFDSSSCPRCCPPCEKVNLGLSGGSLPRGDSSFASAEFYVWSGSVAFLLLEISPSIWSVFPQG